MKWLASAIVILLTLAIGPVHPSAAEPIQHDLQIVLYPEEQRFTAEDVVTVPEDPIPELRFVLHLGLEPTTPTPGARLVRETVKSGPVPLETFRVTLPAGQNKFTLQYGGTIHHPLEAYGKEQARGFQQTPGMIFEGGVYLGGSSFWYPDFHAGLVTFKLQVQLPPEWDAVSQGVRTLHNRTGDETVTRWESPEPQEEIYLVAAAFTEYSKAAGGVDAMVFLRTPDRELASKYLDATVSYLTLYEELIGPYPYKKFALVENFWETGFGMASFTLLGPKIIRFPFILHSSYPHEILHNWWGNGVFPDYTKGNWAEGLTAYLSDHLIKEMRGNGVAYRQQTLQKYTDYVLKERDFPLSQFQSRHSSSSEAVGYGKSLMFFHMLRQQLGDRIFVEALQDFYQKNKFQFASYDDLRQSFEEVSGKKMNVYFDQWLTRRGAPQLKVSKAKSNVDEEGFVLTAVFEQSQPENVYPLGIPVAVTMEGRARAFQTVIAMEKRRLELRLRLPARPLRLDVDPEFDLFRRLDRDEIPPALTQTFGAKKVLILLPSSSSKSLLQAYRKLSQSLAHSGPDEVEVKLDTKVKILPSDRVIILLGWKNRFLSEIASALSKYDVTIKQNELQIGAQKILRENHSVVLTARLPDNKSLSFTWIAADLPESLPGLGRKLPHYHKYSYLGFQGPESTNIAKGRWPILDTPMTTLVAREDGTTQRIGRAKLTRREPLAYLPVVFSKERMLETVRFLSSEELRGRGLGTEELDRAARFIAGKFREAGLEPAGNSRESYFQTWEAQIERPERRVHLQNVVGIIPGLNPEAKAKSVVVGAHYDHLGLGWPDVRQEHRGEIHHGADDNASGVAVLLELARVLGKSLKPSSTVVFVAFTGEEAGRKGSKYFVANQKRFPSEQTIGMLNLDTVGRLEEKKLLVLGAGSASEWVHIFRGAGYVTGVGVETVSKELDSSDQKSFQEAGVPAVQLFTGPHLDYHRPTDTADKIDPEGLVKVASVAKEAIEYLAKRQEPLTNTLKPGTYVESVAKKTRKVSLGIIPDFTYSGKGCRLSGVVPGSPAESGGLREGDVIVRIGSKPVHNLRDLSNVLKSLNPGDMISITFLRADKEMSTETAVVMK